MSRQSPWDETFAKTLIAAHQHKEGAMLPILHALQNEFGYVDEAAIPLIADALNLSKAEVLGTLSFYHDFRQAPAGRRVIKLCRAEACQAVGCEALVEEAKTAHGVIIDAAAPQSDITFETVYCLGNCALGPAALVDGDLVGRIDAAKLAALLDPSGSQAGERA